jgi:hypothetical protein
MSTEATALSHQEKQIETGSLDNWMHRLIKRSRDGSEGDWFSQLSREAEMGGRRLIEVTVSSHQEK